MQLTPLIAVHMTAAIGAIVLGPFALWARMGSIADTRDADQLMRGISRLNAA